MDPSPVGHITVWFLSVIPKSHYPLMAFGGTYEMRSHSTSQCGDTLTATCSITTWKLAGRQSKTTKIEQTYTWMPARSSWDYLLNWPVSIKVTQQIQANETHYFIFYFFLKGFIQ